MIPGDDDDLPDDIVSDDQLVVIADVLLQTLDAEESRAISNNP